MSHDNLFPHLWRLACEAETRRRARWAELTDADAIEARGAWVRATVEQRIGGFPARTPLEAVVTNRFARDGYQVESVIFFSRPRWPVTATPYVPSGLSGPAPAVLSPCGHSENGRCYAEYQRAHVALVRQGYVVLTYDPVSQGERVQYLDADGVSRRPGCCVQHCTAGNQMDLVGAGFANVRIWDGIRALDYLLSRPEVDAARVGVTGNSGGGTLSTLLLCVDERFAAGAPGCYVTTLNHRIATRLTADSEQQFTGMLADGIEHADLLLPAAPKPILVCAASRDFFPLAGTRRTVDDLRGIYATLGAPDAIELCVADGEHGFSRPLREGMVRWFNHWLRGDDSPYAEPEFDIETDRTLWATRSGQVNRDGLGAIELHALVRRDFPIPPVRAPRPLAELLAIDPAAARRPWPVPSEAPPDGELPEVAEGVSVERVAIVSEPDVRLPGLLFTPAQAASEAVLFIPGPEGAEQAGEDVAPLLAAGQLVLALDTRGMGRGRGPVAPGVWGDYYAFYGQETDLVYTSWMLQRPVLGMRVFDALCGVEWLVSRGCEVSIEGRAEGGLIALLTAALDERVRAVTTLAMPLSWQMLYDSAFYDWLPDVFLPGVLRHTDLPDIGAGLAPRPLTLRAPAGPFREPVRPSHAAKAWRVCAAAYQSAGAAEAFRIESPEATAEA
jgi:cephalosporin-C deacetylase-like acetyl esterase